jgi:3-phenylpropionate/trans-cinnamate dioxygenase ferredoxin reductase component
MIQDNRPDDVVIVGASLAGVRTAQSLRGHGYGGSVTVIGDELEHPYDRPPLSKQFLTAEWPRAKLQLSSADDLASQHVNLILGHRATGIDARERQVFLDDGTRHRYGALVVATGASPRRWPFESQLSGISNFRTIDDALQVRAAFERGAAVVIVGAGFIGTEIASAAAQRGLDVTVVDVLDSPLEAQLGRVGAAALIELHRDHGVKILPGRTVAGLHGAEHIEVVELDDGTKLPADILIVGVGVEPNTRWLSGTALDGVGGVPCSAAGATAVPGIWSVGDVARWMVPRLGRRVRFEHWTNAVEQAGVVARNLLGLSAPEHIHEPVPYVWTDQYGQKIQQVGRRHDGDTTTVVYRTADNHFVAVEHNGQHVNRALALGVPQALPHLRRAIRSGADLRSVISLF